MNRDTIVRVQTETLAELRRRTARRGMRKRVAHEAGVSEPTISRVLRGELPPSLDLAFGLGVVVLRDQDRS